MNVSQEELVKIEEIPITMPLGEEFSSQIEIARKYPRSLDKCLNSCIALVTLDMVFAQSCVYSMPVDGQRVTGPSVHLARMLAQQYGNLRAEAQMVDVTDKHVISEAIAFDLETNYAVKIRVWRRIINKTGKRYSEAMITTTGMAATAIAFRNAVFYVTPKPLVNKIMEAAGNTIVGQIQTDQELIARRLQVIEGFNTTYGVSVQELLKYLNLSSVNHITREQLLLLYQLAQAIKDNETTVEEAFVRGPEKNGNSKTDTVFGKP
jgi:hypothetical protein